MNGSKTRACTRTYSYVRRETFWSVRRHAIFVDCCFNLFICSFFSTGSPTAMASAPVRKLSGLQKDVLSLYRSLLRVAVQKDRASSATASSSPDQHIPFTTLLAETTKNGRTRTTTTSHARADFRRQCAEVKRSDFRTIEYLIRKGRKHVKLLQMPGVKGTSSFGGSGAQ